MSMDSSEEVQTNVRLSQTGRQILETIAAMYGISHKAVIEMALREFAKDKGLWSPRAPTDGAPPGRKAGGRT